MEHAITASSSVGIRPGFLPPLPCSAILYGFANSKGSKRPELDGLQGREPQHSGSMLRDENEEARQFRPFRRVRISLLRLARRLPNFSRRSAGRASTRVKATGSLAQRQSGGSGPTRAPTGWRRTAFSVWEPTGGWGCFPGRGSCRLLEEGGNP